MSIEEIINVLERLENGAEACAIAPGEPEEERKKHERSAQALCEAIELLRVWKEAETDPGEVSDGYHTFNELYHHRAVLFSVICNEHPELAWKSKHHHVGGEPMYDGMFIVGIETPDGQATYHYDLDPYWDIFKVKELENAPEWDGHTPVQAIERICSLSKNEPLTLEELKEMDGEPVWVQSPGIPEYGSWRIVAGVDTEDGARTLYCFGDYTCRDYGKVWLAYRRPPKED